MSAPVCDPDYERLADTPTETIMWWWPDRCYRKVKMARLMWGKCDAPADPDVQLTPEPDHFATYAPRETPPAQRLTENLQSHGPATTRDLMKRLGYSGSTIHAFLRAAKDEVRIVDYRSEPDSVGRMMARPVYGLACHGEPVEKPLPLALAHLKQHGGWLRYTDLMQATGLSEMTVAQQLKRNRALLEIRVETCSRHNYVYRTYHYKWRGDDGNRG